MQTTDTLDAAVNSLLMPEENSETVEAPQEELAPETDEGAQEVEAQEAEAGEDEADEAEVETDEGEETEADEENETEGEEAPSKFTVKVDGKDTEVTLDDLKRSYSGQAYIQKGMQEAAEARKEAKALYEALQSEQAQFMQVVQTIQQQGFKAPPQAPDRAMMDSDPIGYMRANAEYQEELAAFQQQQQQLQHVSAQQQQMQQKAMAEYVAEQSKLLAERIPDFADQAKAKEVAAKIRSVASEAYGFSEQELGSVTDARHVQVLHDAMKWRELQATRTQKAPAQTKSMKPKPRRQDPQKVVRKKQIAEARKSGKPEAFVDLLFE